jgi:hypothetical protein
MACKHTLTVDYRARLHLVRWIDSVEAISFDDVAQLSNALAGDLAKRAWLLAKHSSSDFKRWSPALRRNFHSTRLFITQGLGEQFARPWSKPACSADKCASITAIPFQG